MKVALSKEKVESQIQKLGNTPYELSSITTILDEGVSLPISILNQMRRDCIELLNEERIKIKNRNYKSEKIAYKPTIAYKTIGKKIRAKVKNLEQLKAALECDIDSVYYEDIITLDKALEMGIKYNKKVIYSSPRIIRNKEYKHLEKTKKLNLKGVQVGTLGAMDYFKGKNLSIDYYLNAFNSETMNHFKNEGATSLCISQELNLNEIKETLKYTDIEVEAVVYGFATMMVTEYCPMGVLVRDCKKDKRAAKCNQSIYALKNFKGDMFRISQDVFCRSTIYNSNITCMLDNLEEVNKSGIDVFRLDFTHESEQVVKEVIEAHIEVLNNNYRMGSKATKLYNYLDEIGTTSAHYYKGVE